MAPAALLRMSCSVTHMRSDGTSARIHTSWRSSRPFVQQSWEVGMAGRPDHDNLASSCHDLAQRRRKQAPFEDGRLCGQNLCHRAARPATAGEFGVERRPSRTHDRPPSLAELVSPPHCGLNGRGSAGNAGSRTSGAAIVGGSRSRTEGWRCGGASSQLNVVCMVGKTGCPYSTTDEPLSDKESQLCRCELLLSA
jgi:hypothetical protein